jgi:diguanylate cyclase (GGDEF)-like protein
VEREESVRVELRNYRKDGSLFWNEATVSPVHDEQGRLTHYLGIVNDVTDRKRYQQQLEYQAGHDLLTDLANRNLLSDRLAQSLLYARRSGRIVALLLLDLDRFKVVNDSLGHGMGDELLKLVAQRLSSCIRDADTVARLGGDEFAVALAEVAEIDDVGLVAKKIRETLIRPFVLAGREIGVTASIGISLFPRDGENSETLVRNADIAMYRAKEAGGDTFRFFAAEMNLRVRETLDLESDLRRALERGDFLLHYQPKLDLASGRIIGCEGLVRWQHPNRGLVSPGAFIPLAEETGLIVPLGEWVLAEACRQARAWQKEGLTGLCVGINLSARQFHDAGLIDRIRSIIEASGLDPRWLELELTESMIMRDPTAAVKTMHQLKGLGVSLALDDFGTGYSSLNYLRRFPVDALKIDRSFITDVESDPSCASVATSVVAIAHSLSLAAVAEGVETPGQAEFLAGCHCDQVQGFLYSKPLPVDEFAALLRSGHRPGRD